MTCLLIALRPDKLATPTLRHVDDDVMMTWQSPSNGDITSYLVDCRCFLSCLISIFCLHTLYHMSHLAVTASCMLMFTWVLISRHIHCVRKKRDQNVFVISSMAILMKFGR